VKFQKFVSLSLAKDVERAKRPLPFAADGPSIHPSAQQHQHQQLVISTYFCNEEHFQRLLVTLAQRNPKGEEDKRLADYSIVGFYKEPLIPADWHFSIPFRRLRQKRLFLFNNQIFLSKLKRSIF
jgi:hypothetical protein